MASSSQSRRNSQDRFDQSQRTTPHSPFDDRHQTHHGHERASLESRRTNDHYLEPSIPPAAREFQSRSRSQTFNSTYSTQSYASSNPYNHVSQDHFYSVLQDNIRQQNTSASLWSQSRASTPVNDTRHIHYSPALGSAVDLLKSEASSPIEMSFKEKWDRKDTSTSEGAAEKGSSSSSKPPTAPPAGPPAIKFSKPHEILFIVNVCLAQLLSLACLAQTVSPLLIIADSLGISHPGELAWLTASYSMSLGTFIVPAGRLGDMFGHKKIFILGFLWLALWSFMCGLSYNWGFIPLCVFRGLQGIGPALLVPNGIALIGRSFPPGDKRAMVIGIFGACGPCGFLTGAAFAGMFAEVAWWPWAFWSTAIACLFITFISFIVIPDQLAVAAAPPGQKVPTFDWVGTVTGVTGLMLINFALNQAPLVGWSTPYVYFLLIIGLMFAVAFFFIEMHLVKDPLLPVRGLQPQALLTLGCIAAGWASHGVWLYYYYMFQMHLRNLSGTHATLQLIWVGPLGIIFALSTGLLIKRFHVSRVMFAAMVFFLVGSLLLTYAPVGQTYWAQTFLSVLITPGGMNLSFPAGCLLLSNAMPREHQGKAASLVSTVVNYSIASGLGFAGSVESRIAHSGGSLLDGYRGAWELGIGFSALGVVLSLYFIWTARHQIKEARSKRPDAPTNDAVNKTGQRKIFSISTANLHRPAPQWATRITSQIYGVAK